MKNLNKLLKIALTLCFGCFFLQGYSQKNNFTIKGSLKDMPSIPKKVYLIYPEYFHHANDSTVVKNGSYELSGYTDEITTAQLITDAKPQTQRDKLNFMLAPGVINILSTGGFSEAAFSGNGSAPTLAYVQVLEKGRENVKEIQKNMTTEKYKADPKFRDQISNQLMGALGGSIHDIYVFTQSHTESSITPSLIYTLIASGFVTPKAIDTLLANYPKSAINGRLHQEALNSITAREKKAKDAVLARQKASDEKIPLGSKAIEFTANDPNGKSVSLSSFKGKYVLVDFWASWCGPCRQENPNVVKAYKKYKSNGFEVVGFSLDLPSQKEAWLAAIKADGLDWTQVSDLKGFKGETAKLYVIDAIPQNFLIDPNGNIVGKNLRGEDLEKKLASIFNK